MVINSAIESVPLRLLKPHPRMVEKMKEIAGGTSDNRGELCVDPSGCIADNRVGI